MPKSLKQAIAACITELKKGELTRIQIFPAGSFSPLRGAFMGEGPWHMDEAAATRLINKMSAQKNPILIDYEHQSLTANELGHPAPAAGWVSTSSLEWHQDGFYAVSDNIFTQRAAAMIGADEYRYLSPVFIYDKTTGQPIDILSIGLTNTPAIDNMKAITLAAAMASITTTQGNAMELSELMERLCYLFNLPLTTTPEEMKVELDKVKTMLGADTATTGTAAATSLLNFIQAKDSQIAALTLAAERPDPERFVPVAVLTAMQGLAKQSTDDGKKQAVAALISANPTKIIPAAEQWATDLGLKDISLLEQYLAATPPIAALSTRQSASVVVDDADNLTAEELAVCRAVGISADDFKQSKLAGEA